MTNLKSIFKSRDIYLPTKVHLVKAMVFPVVMYAYEIWLSWVAKNWCFWTVVLENTVESHLDSKKIQPVHPKGNESLNIHWKDWCWSWSSNTLPIWYKELTHWKRPWSWERPKAGGEGADRGGDGWMASLTRWTWVLASSRSWWWVGRPGVLQSMGSQRIRHDWATELNCTFISWKWDF